jgi:alkanesulfonate monooxygenase SsuD/methylene tetrahydromethanopterin reductase-like flavin-dependent oxidoreductase (luciferase family)
MADQLHLAVDVDTTAGIEALAAQVQAAEEAGFAFVTIAGSPLAAGRIEAGVAAAYLSQRTALIGLAPALHVTVTEPFHLATQVASLDHASLGRGGWVVGAEHSADAYATIGAPPLTGPDLRREIADVIDVTRQLWDSWEDDAVIRDRVTGRFLDADRVHHVSFTGARFSVAGPLITPRPPQGQPVVLGADTLGVTGRLDVALIAATSLDELTRRARQARADGAPLVFADAPGDRPEDVRGLLRRLDGVVDGVRFRAVDPLPLIDEVRPRLTTGPTLRDVLGLPRPANQFASTGRK